LVVRNIRAFSAFAIAKKGLNRFRFAFESELFAIIAARPLKARSS
jgi:hypothetical protein